MPIDLVTPNRNYPLPEGANDLSHDVLRLIAALQAIDIDVAAILTAIVQKAPLLNAPLSGAPTAPTPSVGDNSTRIATTAWARLYFADFVGAAPAALDTIAELAAALQNDPSVITNLTTLVGNKITGPAVAVADNIATFNGTTGKIAKDSGVAVSSMAPKASPAFTGVPTAPTAAQGTNTTQLATTAHVKAGLDLKLDYRASLVGAAAQLVTDWNNALENGWYMNASGANGPTVDWYLGTVESHSTTAGSLYRTQTVHNFTVANSGNTLAWRRHQQAGVWGAWYKLILSQAESDARFLQLANAKLQGFYESPQQTITAGGLLTLAHGLAAKPKLYLPFLQCTTADQGYAIGDELAVNPNFSATDPSGRGLSIVPTATSLLVRIGNDSFAYTIIRKDTGGVGGITNASWKLVMRAWL
ncbi:MULTISPECIES: pyocin knob domain-containing protein [unclassified Mesorhizobium]|uniref:pyocin knob domain-containing protein n=1 Tax=unclassified Mesorhizobium TaxID=325217 RepID=UPI003336232B